MNITVTPRGGDIEAVLRDTGGQPMGRAGSRIGAVDAIAQLVRTTTHHTGLNFEFAGGGAIRTSAKCIGLDTRAGDGNSPDEAISDLLIHGGAERLGISISLDLNTPFADVRRTDATKEELMTFGTRVFKKSA